MGWASGDPPSIHATANDSRLPRTGRLLLSPICMGVEVEARISVNAAATSVIFVLIYFVVLVLVFQLFF